MDRGRDSEMELDGDKAVSHSCCVCGKSFPFQSSLSQHMRKHTGEKPYKCPYCDHRASQKGNLKIHIRSHRTGTLVQSHEFEAGGAPLGELRASGGLDMCASPSKTPSACKQILNGALPGDGGKILLRSGRKETDAVGGGEGTPFCKGALERKRGPDLPAPQAPRPFKCRLCSYVTLREDSLLSHVEKDHITAQAPSGGGVETATENGRSELPAGEFPCEVCGQAFSQTWFLKAHMKKHRGSFDHGCHICGRRFKEPWFLKNHLKAHGPKAAGKNRPRSELDPIATINNVVQEETIVSGLSLYEICPKCGNLFTNLASLSAHSAVHQRTEGGPEPGPADAQQRFLHSLSLQPAGRLEARTDGRRVAELDPVSSYQAWQLATRGRVAEPAELLKAGGAEEVAGGAEAAGVYRELELSSPDKRKRDPAVPAVPGHPRKRAGGPGEAGVAQPGDLDYRPASRQGRRSVAQSKSSECFECGKIFRTYHQMVLHSRVHRRARRAAHGHPEPGRASRARCGSLSEGDSVSGPSSPGSASAADDSPGSGLADEAADDSGEEGAQEPVPGAASYGSPEEAEPALLARGAPSLALGEAETSGVPALVHLLEKSRRDAPRRLEPRVRVLLDPKTAAPRPEPEGDTSGHPAGADHPKEKPPSDMPGREPPGAGPLDLSALSSRGASSGEAAPLPVHPCPYCNHRTLYPEALWVHKRIWHRVGGSASVPLWVQPNGARSVKNHLVYLARSGRTGPPPALGGKECQPLPVARFARTQGPGAGPAPRGGSSPMVGVTTKATGPPRAKEAASSEPGAQGQDGHRQALPGLTPAASQAQPKPEQGAQLTPTPSVIARAGPLAPSKPAEKQRAPSPTPTPKHSALDSAKAKLSSPPPCQPPGKGDGAQPLPPRETVSKATPEPRTLGGVSGARASPALQAPPTAKQEPAAEDPEKHVDIVSIFKTFIPKDLATLYQGWGSSGPALEHRGTLRLQACQGDLQCAQCGKHFTQPSHLRAHARAHAGESPS
ncbi:zinc finger protein 516 isoform X2 [Tenrec ecaudatus]|uniref:zinc finger protein 516 isoform X2 n=1 Tax=Tenrec ecaudatus TaxID=94439 RepID=UPI003F592C36